jgi:hypothetical protein
LDVAALGAEQKLLFLVIFFLPNILEKLA